jgi:hypothetical protein
MRYHTLCASIHSIAPWRCGGQKWKWGWRVQSAGIWRGSRSPDLPSRSESLYRLRYPCSRQVVGTRFYTCHSAYMSYLFLVRFLIAEALKCFRHVGVVIVAFVSVQKVRSIEGVVFVTSSASQCWISTVSFIFCLVFLQMHVIVFLC